MDSDIDVLLPASSGADLQATGLSQKGWSDALDPGVQLICVPALSYDHEVWKLPLTAVWTRSFTKG